MLIHKIDARVEIQQHVQKIFTSDQSPCTRGIETSGKRFKIGIILQICANLIG
jgi:hypothetical protein